LLNYFNSYAGEIFIDNIEYKNINRDFFINNISVINQVPYIIDGFSIRENLELGVVQKYSDADILGLLKKFGLKDKILKNRL
jgi:ABC-type multidrug transport system fused ATPase/permease subunit